MGCLEKLFTAVIVVVLAFLLLVGVARWSRSVPSTSDENSSEAKTVIMRAPAAGKVQLFDAMTANANVIALVPDGRRCSVLEQSQEVVIEGMSMRFYKVDCRGDRGYVNAKWVAVE